MARLRIEDFQVPKRQRIQTGGYHLGLCERCGKVTEHKDGRCLQTHTRLVDREDWIAELASDR